MSNDFPSMDLKLPKIKPKFIKIGIAVIVIAVFLFGSIYQIQPEEAGIILRLGKFVRTTEPGLHFKLPLGIEKLIKVPVQRQLKMEFGFRTTLAGISSEFQVTQDSRKEAVC